MYLKLFCAFLTFTFFILYLSPVQAALPQNYLAGVDGVEYDFESGVHRVYGHACIKNNPQVHTVKVYVANYSDSSDCIWGGVDEPTYCLASQTSTGVKEFVLPSVVSSCGYDSVGFVADVNYVFNQYGRGGNLRVFLQDENKETLAFPPTKVRSLTRIPLKGDLNKDWKLDMLDVLEIIRHIFS